MPDEITVFDVVRLKPSVLGTDCGVPKMGVVMSILGGYCYVKFRDQGEGEKIVSIPKKDLERLHVTTAGSEFIEQKSQNGLELR